MLHTSRGYRHVACASILSLGLFIHGVFAPRVVGADLQTAVSEARSAAYAGDYPQAFTKGIAAFEAHAESEWNRSTLENFILKVSDDWFVRMTVSQKQASLAALDSVQSPAAKATRAYAKWKLGQRSQAVSEWMAVINQDPDSAGAYWAIYANLIARWNSLSDSAMKSEVSSIVQTAPNNPGSAWAICRVTWRLGSLGKFSEIRQFYTPISDAQPNSLSANVCGELKQMLDAIEAEAFSGALTRLAGLREYLRSATKASMIIDTFFKDIDWKNPQGSSARITALRDFFGPVADNTPDAEIQSFAMAVLARILEKQGKKTESADELQRIIDTGGPMLLKSYAVTRIGHLVQVSDPDRAIAALEMHRAIEAPRRVAGIEQSMITLGRLYLNKGKHDKAEELFGWLLGEAQKGEFLFTDLEEHVAAGLSAALLGQQKNNEAQTILDPYLAKYRYGAPKKDLTIKELQHVGLMLQMSGKESESRSYFAELASR